MFLGSILFRNRLKSSVDVPLAWLPLLYELNGLSCVSDKVFLRQEKRHLMVSVGKSEWADLEFQTLVLCRGWKTIGFPHQCPEI